MYACDHLSRLGDGLKTVRSEKRDFKILATETGFSVYFNACGRLVVEVESFLFLGIEIMLVYKITVSVIRF